MAHKYKYGADLLSLQKINQALNQEIMIIEQDFQLIYHSDDEFSIQEAFPEKQNPQSTVSLKETLFEELTVSKKKTKKQHLEAKKKRKHGRWSKEDRCRYFKFYLKEIIRHPYLDISWFRWKPNLLFPRMANFIGTKDKQQVKSYDQRMKELWHGEKGLDVYECAVEASLQFDSIDPQLSRLRQQIQLLSSKKSGHMLLIEKKQQIDKEFQNQLDQLYKQVNPLFIC